MPRRTRQQKSETGFRHMLVIIGYEWIQTTDKVHSQHPAARTHKN
jgi:hypothetical protein